MFKDKRETPYDQVVYEYRFNDLVELVDYVSNTPVNVKIFDIFELASEGQSYNWYNTHSLNEALELCLGGDDNLTTLFNEKSIEFAKAFPYLSQKRNIVTSYYGHRPNISRYLTSNPRCMYKLERNETYNIIDIHYNVSASHATSTESLFNRGVITINMIKFLESLGFRIRFNFFELCRDGNEYFYVSVNLKRPEERISPSICYFPMCNPSFLRRILSRVKETTEFENKSWNDTYGRIIGLEELNNNYGKIANINMDNCILIGNPRYMGIDGKDIFDDARNLFTNINLNNYLGDNEVFFNENTRSFSLKRKR